MRNVASILIEQRAPGLTTISPQWFAIQPSLRSGLPIHADTIPGGAGLNREAPGSVRLLAQWTRTRVRR